MTDRLERQDIIEHRSHCPICAYETTFFEIVSLNGYCVFCAPEGLTRLKCLSKLRAISLVLGDLDIVRAKIAMKDKGLTEQDYQACLGQVKEDLRFVDNEVDMKKLCKELKSFKAQDDVMSSPI